CAGVILFVLKMGRQRSLRSKAAHFVSDLTTVLLNPISDKPSSKPSAPSQYADNASDSRRSQLDSIREEGSEDLVGGPDTSSFSAFLYSLLTSSEPGDDPNVEGKNDKGQVNSELVAASKEAADVPRKESGGKKSLFSRGKQSLGKAFNQAAKVTGYRNQEQKGDGDMKYSDVNEVMLPGVEMRHSQNKTEPVVVTDVPETSEPSLLLSEKTRGELYTSLPALVQGRKWLLLYSTWRHGISLSTLYRRSMLWPGLSLLVVGDRKGAVFGSLVEAPLRPNNKRKYQGTNSTFVFTDAPGHPVVYRPTGANRYYTLCSSEFLAIGGGGHFAIYLDGDLLNGSSSVSETYGNPCLARSEDFEVKEVELWGFVYASKYEEMLALSRTESPGICRW
ncbi:TLDc domain-containing protein, partial [Psidium guajava]